MDPGRKRKLRLFGALATVVLWAAALAYTRFHVASDARKPNELGASAESGRNAYQLTGRSGSKERS